MGSLSFGLSNAWIGKNKMDGSLIARAKFGLALANCDCFSHLPRMRNLLLYNGSIA